jgi:integrase
MLRETSENSYISEETEAFLSYRRKEVLNERRKEFANWCLKEGKDPEKGIPLSEATTRNYLNRLDKIHREIFRKTGKTTRISPEVADDHSDWLKDDEVLTEDGEEYSLTSKRKRMNALSKWFTWKSRERGGESWECDINFRDNSGNSKDEFTKRERQILREEVLDFKTPKSYNNTTPQERDRWKVYLSQSLGVPKEDITPEDWEKQTCCWKLPSLLYVSLDAGLRPIEVYRSTVDWARVDKGTLAIPKEESAKNRENWEVALNDGTARILGNWLEQRDARPKYDGRNELWLNKKNNPYSSGPLNNFLNNLLEETEIDTSNRNLSWYSIRHSVGDGIGRQGNIVDVMTQLRQKSVQSARKYVNPSAEDLRELLEKIG